MFAFALYTIAGKTIQTAGFLQFLNEHQDVSGPFLVVAPLSTVVNWQRELLTWTGALFDSCIMDHYLSYQLINATMIHAAKAADSI
jgi:SNF2-related domain